MIRLFLLVCSISPSTALAATPAPTPNPIAGFYSIAQPTMLSSQFAEYAIPLVTEAYCRHYLEELFPANAVREGLAAIESLALNLNQRQECAGRLLENWSSLKLAPEPEPAANSDSPETFESCPSRYARNSAGQCYLTNYSEIQQMEHLHYSCPPGDRPLPSPTHNAVNCFRTRTSASPPSGTAFPYYWLQGREALQIVVSPHQLQDAIAYLQRRLLGAFASEMSRGRNLKVADFCAGFTARQAEAMAYYRRALDAPFEHRLPISLTRLSDTPLLFQNGLDELAANAIVNYMSSHFEKVNKAIWRGEVRPLMQKYIEITTEAMERLPPFRGTSVRITTLPDGVLEAHQPGQIVTYDAFTSTSRNLRLDWDGRHRFLIHSGQRGRYVNPVRYGKEYHTEDEVLFPPGTRFKVLSRVERRGGQINFVLAEVDDAGSVVHAPAPRMQVPLIFSPY